MFQIVLATILACAAAAPGLIGAGYAAPGLIGASYGAHGLIGPPVAPWGGIASGYVGAPIVKTAVPVATSYANTVRVRVSRPLTIITSGLYACLKLELTKCSLFLVN